MENIQNLAKPGASFEQLDEETGSSQSLVHIRLQQRNTRKTITTIQGLDDKNDLGRLVQHFKKIFQCNGTVIDHPEYGKVIQLAGDQRQLVKDFLVKVGIVSEEQCKMHGF